MSIYLQVVFLIDQRNKTSSLVNRRLASRFGQIRLDYEVITK